ncbi:HYPOTHETICAL PROTEIN MCJ_000810 [Mesomycoplasma conjunctivae]|uniref:Uncharacterized protein n=1 Tax=Mesomycoplasma conjunctivae (strain ATCC 25834 / NCTC 10147 / HRC/581) TaxID=572263 RepID=C5J5N3_MESCH|nr:HYPOTHETICAL PROTEIN MCJ_000810 [Mesomycoplasma conjunctivae]
MFWSKTFSFWIWLYCIFEVAGKNVAVVMLARAVRLNKRKLLDF